MFGKYEKGDPDRDSLEDQKANIWGRNGASTWPNQSCEQTCKKFRPKGLPKKY